MLIEQYGDSFDYLGNHEGADYFLYKFPEDVTTGFPFVFRYGDGPVMTFSDFEALDLINLFIKISMKSVLNSLLSILIIPLQ